MIHVRDAARDGIEHLEGADELSRSKDLNFKAAAGDRRDRAAKSFSAGAKTGKAFRPARYQLELPDALCDVTMQISPIRRPNAPSTRSTSPTRTVYRCS